jgi:hypothetical protein
MAATQSKQSKMIHSISVNDVGTRNNRPRLVTAAWLCLFVIVTITAITLRLSNPDAAFRSPDEEVYIHYATRLATLQQGYTPVDLSRAHPTWLHLPCRWPDETIWGFR